MTKTVYIQQKISDPALDYIRVPIDYFQGPQATALRNDLGVSADVYPLRLWAYAYRSVPGGIFTGGRRANKKYAFIKRWIEKAVVWPGKAGLLYHALVRYDIIDELPDQTVEIKNWEAITMGFAGKYREVRRHRDALEGRYHFERIKFEQQMANVAQAKLDELFKNRDLFINSKDELTDRDFDTPAFIRRMEEEEE